MMYHEPLPASPRLAPCQALADHFSAVSPTLFHSAYLNPAKKRRSEIHSFFLKFDQVAQ